MEANFETQQELKKRGFSDSFGCMCDNTITKEEVIRIDEVRKERALEIKKLFEELKAKTRDIINKYKCDGAVKIEENNELEESKFTQATKKFKMIKSYR